MTILENPDEKVAAGGLKAMMLPDGPNTDELIQVIEWLLPLAEAYLKHAPTHPDNAKLETARAIIKIHDRR